MDEHRVARVVVAIDPAQLRAAPLEAAARLARHLDLEMTALLIEQETLLRVASLPFTREFRLASGRWQSYEAHDVRRAFEDLSRRSQQLLLEVADRFGVKGRFATARGEFPRRAIELSHGSDVLVVDRAPQPGVAARSYVRVALLFDASPAAVRALPSALQLAQAVGRPLRVVVPADSAATYAQRCALVRAVADGPLARIELVALDVAPGASNATLDAAALARLHRALGDGETTLLVWPGSGDAPRPGEPRPGGSDRPRGARPGLEDDLGGLAATVRCSLVLMR